MAIFDAAPVSPAELEAHRAAERAIARPIGRGGWVVLGFVLGWLLAWPAAFGALVSIRDQVIECGPVTPVMFVRALLP